MKEAQTQKLVITHKGKQQDISLSGDLAKADTFMVVGPNCYGYGESIKVAKANCLVNCLPSEKRKAKFKAYLGDSNLGVTGMGEIKADYFLCCLGEV